MADLVDQLLRVGREEFCASHHHPVLISFDAQVDSAELQYRTEVISGDAWEAIREVARSLAPSVAPRAEARICAEQRNSAEPRPSPAPVRPSPSLEPRPSSAGIVAEIAKKEDRPFKDQIGVGRAGNVDIPLPWAQISKYHGFFTPQADGSYTFTDAGSTNGTIIGTERLAPRTPVPLRDGVEILLGPHRFRFYGAEAFCELVARRAARR